MIVALDVINAVQWHGSADAGRLEGERMGNLRMSKASLDLLQSAGKDLGKLLLVHRL